MAVLLALSRRIDQLNEFVGRWLAWLVLVAVLVSAGTATVRKAFDVSSNALLEIQWYIYAAIFLLAAGYTMLRGEHVKIDVVLSRFSRRTQTKIEVFGIFAFLLPFVTIMVWLAFPLVIRSFVTGEVSSNEGGLIRWPVFALLPLGFVLLGLQGISEAFKRFAYLAGVLPDPADARATGAEEALIQAIRAEAEGKKE